MQDPLPAAIRQNPTPSLPPTPNQNAPTLAGFVMKNTKDKDLVILMQAIGASLLLSTCLTRRSALLTSPRTHNTIFLVASLRFGLLLSSPELQADRDSREACRHREALRPRRRPELHWRRPEDARRHVQRHHDQRPTQLGCLLRARQ